MRVTVRSFAKINLGLRIGTLRPDGYHELRTVYQTIALHDLLRVQVTRGSGIEIRCNDPRVPTNESNTCYRIIERAMAVLKARGHVVIEIEKRLPVQGGLGGASANAISALLALEHGFKKELPGPEKLRIAAEVGSDLPLFLVGGTVLGAGHGEEVYPLSDLPPTPCVVATPEIGISTPKAFADWDGLCGEPGSAREGPGLDRTDAKLTASAPSDRMLMFGRSVAAWLSGLSQRKTKSGQALSGVPVSRGRGRAETPLLDLVRTGIENDFEQVVFPQYPELRDVKRVLKRAGAAYASLSGSGSAIFGLFGTRAVAQQAAVRLRKAGVAAVATTTLTRPQYWKGIFDC
ncbi:MAG: 4-(cytidine 5'-diphospho)-2-C-methyl-D-erythritol kinase [Acidobacteriia bacterium]|nr:4-(cytidine 5'-diphospho)-2-C-methyl-D-erythritol kinase [Terriglobia bacterium]